MNILFIGDIFSSPGRDVLSNKLNIIVKKHQIDFIIANGENISHGKGINKNHYNFLKQLKINVITSGNHIFKQKETLEYISNSKDLLRPLNMNKSLPGLGTNIFKFKDKEIRVTNLMGQVFMDNVNNPYEAFDEIIFKDTSNIHIVDFHAEASAEKLAFAFNYDGKVTAILGTHTHIQTADERIMPNGTAYITDVGMTGSFDSVIGVNPEEVIIKEKLGLQTKFVPSTKPAKISAVIIKIDDTNNKVINISRINEY
ncbi:putative metallophosphatase [Spiroplasma litorale]|uniref:Putative metallophosphatase n=1 Tax=Spiroplasma litorale TaxID=216942 RepID=A0A0K1W107_9MOLU|nr:TIGR00282 family metallophosphoesterase [Spiroplasma litorale]AKX33871.1 putative metallophosphatase [Spiroplasma litorale]